MTACTRHAFCRQASLLSTCSTIPKLSEHAMVCCDLLTSVGKKPSMAEHAQQTSYRYTAAGHLLICMVTSYRLVVTGTMAPPHTRHLVQALSVGGFGTLLNAYSGFCRFWTYWLVLFLTNMASNALFRGCAAVGRDPIISSTVGVLAIFVLVFSGGIMLARRELSAH